MVTVELDDSLDRRARLVRDGGRLDARRVTAPRLWSDALRRDHARSFARGSGAAPASAPPAPAPARAIGIKCVLGGIALRGGPRFATLAAVRGLSLAALATREIGLEFALRDVGVPRLRVAGRRQDSILRVHLAQIDPPGLAPRCEPTDFPRGFRPGTAFLANARILRASGP